MTAAENGLKTCLTKSLKIDNITTYSPPLITQILISQSTSLSPSLLLAVTIREYLYSKFSFGEVYRRIYGRKFSFMATRERSRKT